MGKKDTIKRISTYNKHKAIRAENARLVALNKYKYEYRITKLSEKFFLTGKRIEEILAMDDNDPRYIIKQQQQLFTE